VARWQPQLAVTAESLERWFTFVAQVDGEVVAFRQVSPETCPWEFQAPWVAPQHMRRGVGRALVRHAAEHARARGQTVLAVDADPHAEPFYLRCGVGVVGQVPAPIEGRPARVRPQLVVCTDAI
jgi:GNAT superfamily N-acetyltransferase